jgi:glycine/serine hydroxymethyltransferase
MTGSGDFSFRTSYAAQKQMAELAFALVRMQADTPAGEWVDEHFGNEYRQIWERARSLAGEKADEDLFLALLTHTHVLLAYLVAATGISEAEWLDRLRSDYVDRIPSDGEGVWGPRGLRLGG